MAYTGKPSDLWHETNVPSVAAQATTSRAGVTGIQHVAKRVSASIATGATVQTPLVLYLRDGASGIGAILKAWTRAVGADGYAEVEADFLDVEGTAGNAMTLEWAGAGVANSQQTVSLTGYDLP